jgi:hypothetical protein
MTYARGGFAFGDRQGTRDEVSVQAIFFAFGCLLCGPFIALGVPHYLVTSASARFGIGS